MTEQPTGATESASDGLENEGRYDESIAIVYPVSWPSGTENIPNPHSTIIYLGQVPEVDFTRADVKAAMDEFIWDESLEVALGPTAKFGENEETLVIKLLGEMLYENRRLLEEELNKRGIYDASEYDYAPHITIEPLMMSKVPLTTRLGKPRIWWGSQR